MSLSPKARKPAAAPANPGCVDFIAYCGVLDGWLACGWIAQEWEESEAAPGCTLDFGDTQAEGAGTLCLFAREDVAGMGAGFLLHVPGDPGDARRDIADLQLQSGRQTFNLKPAHQVERPPEAEAISRGKAHLQGAPPSERRSRLLKMMNRPAFGGVDTLQALKTPVFLEIDSAVYCPPAGLLLCGWFADPFCQVASIRVRCGSRAAVLDPTAWVKTARHDVADNLGRNYPDIPPECGFIAFVQDMAIDGGTLHLEVAMADGEIGFKCVPSQRSPGLRAIRDVLSRFDLRGEAMVHAYDHVVGPAVSALNDFVRTHPPAVSEQVFGEQPARPVCSIVVPLYGRIDFMEYQLAFFSRSLDPNVELIYVLDDPPLQRENSALAASCFARFGRPFRLLTLAANIGYGAASNVGLAHARAPHVCFLNSDAFPKTHDWLENMLATIKSDARIGVTGALLLYEDDTIQHEGCSFAPMREFGGWTFCLHPNKGRLPGADVSKLTVEAVTGACLLMRTDLARSLGGFDEAYVVGDFEDADLCRKVQEKGLTCVVDRRAQLYHLERQSQGGQQSAWRLNLTLFNAWLFQKRWASAPARPRAAARAAR